MIVSSPQNQITKVSTGQSNYFEGLVLKVVLALVSLGAFAWLALPLSASATTVDIYPDSIGGDAADSLADIQADDAPALGTFDPDTVGSITADDAVYTVDTASGNDELLVTSFDTSAIPAGSTITGTVLHLQYGAEDVYNGTNYVQYLNGSSVMTNAIQPTDVTDWSSDTTFDIYADDSTAVDTVAKLTAMDIGYTNDDSQSADAVHFDYIYMTVDFDAPTTTISGTIYSDEGTTAITGGPTIALMLGTSTPGIFATTSANGSGAYTFTDVPVESLAQPIAVFVNASTTLRAFTMTKLASTTESVTDLDLYQDHVIVRHQGEASSLTLADLATYDSTNDGDIQFTASSTLDSLNVLNGQKFYIWNGSTFISAASSTYSGSFHNSGGVFTAMVNGTSTFSGTSKTISGTTTGESSLRRIVITGSYTMSNNASTSALTINSGGTLTAPAILTINGDYTNNGSFDNNGGTIESQGIGYDINSYTSGTSIALSVAAEETSPQAMLFNNDGTILYVMGDSGDDINAYPLPTPYDPSSYTSGTSIALSVAGEETAPQAMLFNDDGTILYVLGSTGDDINAYPLPTPYDPGSYTSGTSIALSVAGEETFPRAMLFNDSGTILYVLGEIGDDINAYPLPTPYDISSYTSGTSIALSVAGEETFPSAMLFNDSGTILYVLGEIGDDINAYPLPTPYDISSYTSGTSIALSVAGEETFPSDMLFNNDGTVLYVTGWAGDDINAYPLPIPPSTYSGTMTGSSALGALKVIDSSTLTLANNASTTDLTITTGSTLNLATSTTIAGDYTNNGTVNFESSGDTTFSGTSKTATGTLSGAGALNNVNVTGSVTFGTNASTSDLTIQSGGSFTAPSGTLEILGDYLNDGTFVAPSSLIISGDYTNNGTFTDSGGTVNLSGGSVTIAGTMTGSSDFNHLQLGIDTDLGSGEVTNTFYKKSQATAGTIASGGTASINSVESMVNVDGTLYVGTGKTGEAEVYRFDGGTTWTKISQATAGTIASGGTASINSVESMVNVDGTLYVGTGKTGEAEVYRFDGGTTWTKVSQATAGTIADSGTASINSIHSMASVEGILYIGTAKSNAAEVYRFDGGTTWTKVSSTTAGTIASGGTAGINSVDSMVDVDGTLYVGTGENGGAEVYRFDGGTTWTKVSNATAGVIDDGSNANIDGVSSMAILDNVLYVGTDEPDEAEIYRYDGGTGWTRVSTADTPGQIVSTVSIDKITSLAAVGGSLFAGTDETSKAEVYKYSGSGVSWSLISDSTAGTIVSGGTSAINAADSMTGSNGSLFVGTNKPNDGEVYQYVPETTFTFAATASTSNFTVFNNASVTAPSQLTVSGDYTNNGIFTHNSGEVTFSGSAAQTATGTMTGTSAFYDLTINNTSANGTTSRSVTFVTAASSTATTTIMASSSVAFAAGATSTFTNVVWNGGATTTDPVWIYSTATGTQANLVVTGTTNIYDAMIRDTNVCGSTGGGLTATNSVSVSNNTCWTFALGSEGGGGGVSYITISGTLFSDEGTTQIIPEHTIALAVGTSTVSVQSTTTDSGAGTFSLDVAQTYLNATSGIPLILFVDASTTVAATITKLASTTANITGLNLYQDTVIVRQEGSTSTKLTDLATYDSTDDADLQYTASSTTGELTILNGQEFHIWNGDTFEHTGSSTFNGSLHNDGGIFTNLSQDHLTFSGTAKTISGSTTASSSLGNVSITGSYTMSDNASTSELTINSGGSFTAPTLLTIDGPYTNDGTFSNNSGTVYLNGKTATGTMTGSSAFNNLVTRANGDGESWTTTLAAGDNDPWEALVYGNGLYVAVADCNPSGPDCVMTSPDGITWTARSAAGDDDDWADITYGNGTFVAVADAGNDYGMYSIDGINWSTTTLNGTNRLRSVTYGQGIFVGVNSANDRVMTSPDGITWTARSAAGNNDGWINVDYVKGLFIATSNSGDRVMTSPDGITWTVRSAVGDNDLWSDIAYGNGIIVAVGFGSVDDAVMTSPDGITWATTTAAGDDDDWADITYGNGTFVALSDGATADKMMTSSDGLNWTVQATPGANNFRDVVYGAGRFVAVDKSAPSAMLSATGTLTFANNASTTDITISAGTTTAPTLLTIAGDYTNNGTFTPGSGKVTLTSTSTAATLNAGSSAFNDLDINNGLLAYWKMDEGTSSSTQDWTGNGNTGTLMSNTEWSTDVNATTTYTNPSSLSFDGVDDYVELSNFDLSGTDAVTVAFWLNTAVVTAANKMLFEYSVNSGSNNAFYLNMNETLSNGNIGLMDRDSGENLRNHVNTSGVYADGEWHHVVAVIDRSLGTSQNKLYVDGVDDTVQDASWEDDIDGNFGGPYDSYIISRGGGSEFLNGSIDDFRIYNRALSAAEITDLATGYHPTTTVYTLESDLDVNGDFGNYTGFDTSASNYDVYLAGNATTTGEANHRSGTTTIDGSSAQILVGDMIGTSQFYNLNITNTSGNGTTSRSVIFGNELTATGTFTMAASSSAEFAAGATSTFATVDWQGSVGSPIWLYSTATGTQWNLVAAGTIDYVNVRDSYACNSPGGGVSTDGLTSTDVANNTCWTFSGPTVTISGTLFSDEGTTAITSGPTIKLVIGTTTPVTDTAVANGSGVYTFASVNQSDVATDTPIIVFVDASSTLRAAVVTKASSTSENITGLNLYQDTVIVRQEGSTSTSLTDLATYDSTDDSDLQYTASSTQNTLTILSNQELHIWPGDTFVNAASSTFYGDFHNPGGVFDDNYGVMTFATTTGTISGTTTGSSALGDIVIAGGYTMDDNASTTDLTINSGGSLTAPTLITVYGDYTNNGTFTNNSGTTYFGGVGSFQNDITYTKSTSTLGQTNDPGGIVFSNDGTKMYVTGFTGDSIYQYTLSTAWDVSTASYLQSTTTASQETTPRGLYFKEDGLTLYMVGDASNNVNQYSLSSAWDISTTNFVQSFSVNGQDAFAAGLAFSKDGLKMFMVGWNDAIYEYTLSTAWDISTASYLDSFSVAGQETKPNGMTFSPNGQAAFIIGEDNDSVFRYELSQPWDISSAAYVDSFDVAYYEEIPVSLTFSTNGDILYLLGYDGDKVYQFEMNAEISGTLTGSSAFNNVVFLDDETVFVDNASTTDLTINSGATLNGSSTVSLAGNYTNNGSFDSMYGTVVLTGTSKTLAGTMTGTSSDLNHVIVNGTYTFSDDASINDLTINTGGSLTAPATLTVGGDYTNSGTFTHNSGTVNLEQGDSFTTDISYQQSSTTATQEALPLGLIFKPDGTKMYLSGNSDFIYEYDLTTAWDISTLSYLQSKSVAAQDVIPRGMAISTDGTKLFLAGATGNDINEYTLSPAWDITSASFVDSFSVTNQETGVRDVSVSTDGLTMFVIGSNSDRVHQYSLATAWDVSTASYVKSLSVAAQESVPNGLVFNADGTKLYVVGEISVKLHEYTLSTAWDVATAKYEDEVALGAQDGVPVQFQFSSDGSQAYMLGYANDLVYEYTVTPSSGTTTGTLTGSSAFNNVSITGSKTIIDSNASTSDLSIATNATVTAPTGSLTIDGVYDNNGAFTHNSGTVYLTGIPTFDNDVQYMTATSVQSHENVPRTVDFKPDGTKMYVSGSQNDRVHEYDLSVPWDVTTAVLVASTSVLTNTGTSPKGMHFKPDGTKLFIGDETADEVDSYTLSTAWDISTLTYEDTTTVVNTNQVNVGGLFFKPDGTTMYVGDSNITVNDISEYTLSTPWDITSASYVDNLSIDDRGLTSAPSGLTLSSDGRKLFVTGYISNDDPVLEYRLSTPWDISSASFYDFGYEFDPTDNSPTDVTFSSNGEYLYLLGTESDSVNQFRVIGTNGYTIGEDFNNLVAASGTLNIIGAATTTDFTVAANATATAPTTTLTVTGSYTNNGVFQDNGGTLRLTGTTKTLSGTLTGTSDLGDVVVAGSYTFSNNASTTDLTIESGGSLTAPSTLTVDGDYTNSGTFTHSSGEVVLGGRQAAMEDPVYIRRFDTYDQGTAADLIFSATGTYMYMLNSTETIYQYHLDNPWDISTASVTPQTLSVSALDGSGGGLYFNDTGDLLFYVGSANDEVHEITLSTPWDVSSGSQTATTSVADCCGADNPNDIWFSPGGEYMFVSYQDSISSDNVVSRYDLSTPWDISTASFGVRSGGLSSWFVQQVALSSDGLTMYVLGGVSAADINRYVLDDPWDVSSWTYVDDYDVGHREESLSTFTFGDSFGRLYINGSQNYHVLEYALDPASQTASGTMTGSSAFSALTQSGNQPVTFGASASTTGTYTIASTSALDGATTTVFQAGASYTFQNVDWQGASSSNELVFRSSASGTAWYLDIPGSQLNVEYVNVQDSDATETSGGVAASNNNTDSGNNTNWNFVASADPWNATDWTLYDTITIRHENIDSPLTDFPVYVDLSDLSAQFWSTVTSGGGDIRVTTDEAAPTELPREVVSASTTAETGELHFKADYVSEVIDTSYRVYYNGTDIEYATSDTYGAQNVWSNGYVAVWHLNEDPSVAGTDGILDSTTHNLHGTDGGSMDANDRVAGKLGGYALDFDKSDDIVEVASNPLLEGFTSITYSAWFNPDGNGSGNGDRIISKSDGANGDDYALTIDSGNTNARCRVTTSAQVNATTSDVGTNWSYGVCRYDGANILANIDYDAQTESKAQTGTIDDNNASLGIGQHPDATTRLFGGIIDEVRIASTSRSDAWIKAEYYNQSTTTDFYTLTTGGTGSSTIADHDAGQVSNAFDFQNKTNEALFAFKLTPNSGNATVTRTELAISGWNHRKLDVNDFSNIRLYRDMDNDAAYDAGDVQVGGSGAITFFGPNIQYGTLVFTDDYLATTSQNYVVIADWNVPDRGSHMKLDLKTGSLDIYDSAGSVEVFGTVDHIQHIRNNAGGGGSSAQVGEAPPAGDGDVGGGTNEGGEQIGSDPDFKWPSANSGSWTTPANAYDQTDGTYATDNAGATNNFSDHGFSVGGSNQIDGIIVKLEISGTTAAGDIGVELSWDGGTSWTSSQSTPTLTTTDAVVTVGGSGDTWGRSWTPSEFSNANFVVRLTGNPSSNTVQVDAIQVRVFHSTTGGGGGGGGAI